MEGEDSTTWKFSTARAPRRVNATTLDIVAHPSLERVGEISVLLPGQPWEISRKAPAFSTPNGPDAGRPLDDRFLSRSPILLQRSAAGISISRGDCTSPVKIDGVKLERALQLDAERVERGVVIELGPQVALLLKQTELHSGARTESLGMVGETPELHRLRQQALLAAAQKESVLILGESGAGKELVARAIHAQSARREGPFLAINLATLPATIAAAELFGYRQGAFTGAQQDRPGLFERASGGTLFLDEVGEASMEVQAMLLRALEERAILPLGQAQEQPVDVRVIAATDANLEGAITQGSFRAALYHRLMALELRVPALRERRADIARLFSAMLQREHSLTEAPSWLTASVAAQLLSYDWPGNVRQLHNVIRRLMMLGDDPVEVERALKTLLPEKPQRADIAAEPDLDAIARAMKAHDYNVHATAKTLGMSRATLYRRLRAHPELRPAKDIDDAELRERFEACGGQLKELANELRTSKTGLKMRLRQLKLIP